MTTNSQGVDDNHLRGQIDWMDIKFACVLGVILVVVKVMGNTNPSWQIRRITTDDIASVLTVAYILFRARKNPWKLEDWGLTTRLTLPALLSAVLLLGVSLGILIAGGILTAGRLSFEPFLLSQMVEYIPAAFPQQFVMCSVGLATLATLKPFRGSWRLPLAVGVVFCLAHFWTPARIPGTIIPIQMMLTLPAGFFAAFYFLKFRSILPLTVIHAIGYPLLYNWIEMNL